MRILTTLTEPMTSSELFEVMDMGYPYGIKVLRKLKNEKFIDEVQRIGKPHYFTIRTHETEEIFAARAKATGKSEYVFPFRGEWQAFLPLGRRLAKKPHSFPLLELANRILMNLRYNSYRKEKNMVTQRPYSEDMRHALESRLANARIEIQFVEEMLKAPIWDDTKHTYKIIATEDVDLEKGKINSDTLGERLYKK
jgi:hypothetical protein